MSSSTKKRVARCVGYSAVAVTLAAIAAASVALLVPGCGQDGLTPQRQPDARDGSVADHHDEQIDQLDLRRRTLSDEGIVLIYDAAMPAGAEEPALQSPPSPTRSPFLNRSKPAHQRQCAFILSAAPSRAYGILGFGISYVLTLIQVVSC